MIGIIPSDVCGKILTKTLGRAERYLNDTRNYRLHFVKNEIINLIGYSDKDWAGDLDDCKSTSGYLFKLSGVAIIWRRKTQTYVASSNAETEYMALASAAQKAIWKQRLLYNFDQAHVGSALIYEDNQSTICMVKNPQYQERVKHIDIKFNYIREQVKMKTIELKSSK